VGNLAMMLAAVMCLMWILEKTHIFVISYLPFYQFLLIFAGLLIVIRLGWKKMIG